MSEEEMMKTVARNAELETRVKIALSKILKDKYSTSDDREIYEILTGEDFPKEKEKES